MALLDEPAQAWEALRSARTVAVLGASDSPFKAGFYVPDALWRAGYRVLPVNPRLVGEVLWGEPVRATLIDLPVPVDLIDVFRRPELLPAHVDEILAMRPLPRVVWFQLGIRHDAVARELSAAGIDVVQDRCTQLDLGALAASAAGR